MTKIEPIKKVKRLIVALFMLIPFSLSSTFTAFADIPLELAWARADVSKLVCVTTNP